MRLPEAKIRDAILHPEVLVRTDALLYFTGCFSRDAQVMPLVIETIEKYGREHAFPYLHYLAQLTQTEATIEWAVKQLHRVENKFDDVDSVFPALSHLLCNADPELLKPRADEILQAPGFVKERREPFQDRLRLAAWDADQCWTELEKLCVEGVGGNVDDYYASRVVEALARQGDKYTDRILELLAKEVVDFDTDPMADLEIYLVMLAGEMRLERAVPLIVDKLRLCGEVLSERSVEALSKICTDGAAEAIAEGWQEAEWDYRLYATSALENIHCDATVRKCLELIPLERKPDIRTRLADALLSQFDGESIEPVRQMVQRRTFDPMTSDLMQKLVCVSTVLGATFPEYPIWKREVEEQFATQERKKKELERGFFHAPAPVVQKESNYLDRAPAPFVRAKQSVGRNDSCPCGSGKKYKKCCLAKNMG